MKEDTMETDIKDLENLITGLTESLKALRADKEIFVKAQGVDIEAEKLKAEASKFGDEASTLKALIKELQAEKSAAIKPTIKAIQDAMNAMLTHGAATLSLEENGAFLIGWDDVLYPGLSGGEKIIIDAALANALGADILAVEAAEVDSDNLMVLLEQYAKLDDIKQVIVSTCHVVNHDSPMAMMAPGWEVTYL